jgi:radical SAM protein with 4Fe4S-binding SPASM domain
MNNLDYLIELKKNRRSDITIVVHKIVFDEDNIESLKDYIRYFYIDKGVDKITFAPIVKEGNINNKNWLIMRNQIETDMIKDNIDINLRDFCNYPYRSIHKYCGTNLLFIGHNGDFAPCGLHTKSKDNFGNLLTESLDEITEKEVFKEYHRYWLNRDFSCKAPKICSNCYLLKSPYFVYCLDAGYEHGNKFKNNL